MGAVRRQDEEPRIPAAGASDAVRSARRRVISSSRPNSRVSSAVISFASSAMRRKCVAASSYCARDFRRVARNSRSCEATAAIACSMAWSLVAGEFEAVAQRGVPPRRVHVGIVVPDAERSQLVGKDMDAVPGDHHAEPHVEIPKQREPGVVGANLLIGVSTHHRRRRRGSCCRRRTAAARCGRKSPGSPKGGGNR